MYCKYNIYNIKHSLWDCRAKKGPSMASCSTFSLIFVFLYNKKRMYKKIQIFVKQGIPFKETINSIFNRILPLKFNLELFPISIVAKHRHRKNLREIIFHKSDVQP